MPIIGPVTLDLVRTFFLFSLPALLSLCSFLLFAASIPDVCSESVWEREDEEKQVYFEVKNVENLMVLM